MKFIAEWEKRNINKFVALWAGILLYGLLISANQAFAMPQFIENVTQFANGTVYVCSNSFGFQVNCTDSTSSMAIIGNVTFEIGGVNYTRATTPAVANNTDGIYWINLSLSAGTRNIRWFANDTSNNWNATTAVIYVVGKASPRTTAWELNDTYITFNDSIRILVNSSCNALVKVQTQSKNGTNNYTAPYDSATKNYTFTFTKIDLGSLGTNGTLVNITVFTDGGNYTAIRNGTAATFNFSYGTANALSVVSPAQALGQEPMTLKTNYTSAENNVLLMVNCSFTYDSQTYYMEYSGGYQQKTFPNTRGSTGASSFVITCSNSSYQTRTYTGSIDTYRAGSGNGGLPGITLPQLPQMQLPNLQLPQISWPSLPMFALPSISMPSFEMLEFEFPILSLPQFQFPSFEWPRFELPSWLRWPS